MLPTKEKIIASGDNEGMSIKLWMQNIIKQELSPEPNLHVWRTYIVMLASIKYNPHTPRILLTKKSQKVLPQNDKEW